jgi:hypothetical protein
MSDLEAVAPIKVNGKDLSASEKDLFHVSINDQTFLLTPLKCKHLRTISSILRDKSAQTATDFSSVERWMPFVFDSLHAKHPDFTQEMLDDMTLQEFNDTWEKIVAISGVSLAKK